jgi:hypothetical protein
VNMEMNVWVPQTLGNSSIVEQLWLLKISAPWIEFSFTYINYFILSHVVFVTIDEVSIGE